MSKLCFPPTASVLLALLLSACATAPPDQGASDIPLSGGTPQLTAKSLSPPAPAQSGMDVALAPKAPIIYPGTGNFINRKAAITPAPATRTAAGEVTLNFDGADIRDVAKVIFETLKENYTVDPQVQGEVTVQTSRPLARDQLLPTLETLLRMNQAVLVREGNLYKIVPAAGAVRQGGLRPRLGSGGGYGVRIVPLNYISAVEMQAIIAPFLPEGGVLRADVSRNLLILAGAPQELANVQSTIDTFDVNWLKGMSIGMFRLRNVDSQAMATELSQLLGEDSKTPIAGLLRFVPLSKLNAVLVITPQVEYLKQVATWIERLDGIGGERLYVYAVQNSRADYVAELLNGLFNLGGGGGAARGGEVAPGLRAGQVFGGGATSGLSGGASSGLGGNGSGLGGSGSGLGGGGSGLGGSGSGSSSLSGGSTGSGAGSSRGTLSGSSASPMGGGRAGGRSSGAGGGGVGAIGSGGPSAGMEEVRIVADTENNSLLIWATSQNYERIIGTLEKMDVPPRQVLIEATIAEVTLTGSLQYGLQWFFNNDVGKYTGSGSLGLPTDLTLRDAFANIPSGQFSYAITDSAGIVKALLNALASDSKVKVLSSPQLMVVDNQQAQIRVGTQQPIPSGTTTTSSGVTTSGGVEYKETGVLLEVLPRVNAGGMVNMEVKQEVVDLGPLVDVSQVGSVASRQRSFSQRNVTSKVTVKSGQTLVLGGLIRDNRTEGKSGFPILYRIPVLGALFGNTSEQVDRTELLVLITPRVVENSQEAGQVTEEIKRKLQQVAPLVAPAG